MADFGYIEKNLCEIHEKINNAKLKRDNKYNKEVRLMAVTKTVPVEQINFAVSRGISLIGENRVSELLEKYDAIEKDNLELHFIGNLQTNKVKYIIDKVNLIQSVNSVRLAEEINKRANLKNIIMDILVEINIGGEESKIGISPDGCLEFIKIIKDFKNIKVRGLMTIPPFEASLDKTEIKKYFNRMQEIYGRINKVKTLNIDILSMGMSEDFEEAVECGSDIIRIGRGIFGER
jgi:pyridoxal phosphate enzyme (YggS family)